MNYIELINIFWELDETWQFSCPETRLYFYLVRTANRLMWEENWTRSDLKVSGDVGVSVNSIKSARDRLASAGLISFKSGGKGYGDKTRYQILIPKSQPKSYPKSQPKVQPKCDDTLLGTIKQKHKHPPNPPKGVDSVKEIFDFSFVKSDFTEIFKSWLDYKAAKKKKYKTQASIEACYRNLEKLSGGVPNIAKQVVEQSMANNWDGLFELKNNKNETNSRIFIGKQDYGTSTI